MKGRRFLISGRVQGVFFRASTQQVARRLGITGSAINLPDGRVEVTAFGPPEALDELAQWLQHGPPGARVDHIEQHAVDGQPPERFVTG
ncbi:MAG: hypothetical protein Kow0020_05010 [Wenzhouxiangellaceae bacterium]